MFLIPDSTITADGVGGAHAAEAGEWIFTLGILAVEEQESLDVTIQHSGDGETWTRLAVFPQKFYAGTHQIYHAAPAGFLQAKYHVNRWGRGELTPRFRAYCFAQRAEI